MAETSSDITPDNPTGAADPREPVRSATSDAEIVLDSIRGKGYPVRDWLTAYPLLLVALDPYTHESAWILDTAADYLDHYRPSDVRVGWLVAADDDGCREFLGPLAETYLTFADPDRTAIEGFGLQTLPALLHVCADGSTQVANGWDPLAWRAVSELLSEQLGWTRPLLPKPGDPLPYRGTRASG